MEQEEREICRRRIEEMRGIMKEAMESINWRVKRKQHRRQKLQTKITKNLSTKNRKIMMNLSRNRNMRKERQRRKKDLVGSRKTLLRIGIKRNFSARHCDGTIEERRSTKKWRRKIKEREIERSKKITTEKEESWKVWNKSRKIFR